MDNSSLEYDSSSHNNSYDDLSIEKAEINEGDKSVLTDKKKFGK